MRPSRIQRILFFLRCLHSSKISGNRLDLWQIDRAHNQNLPYENGATREHFNLTPLLLPPERPKKRHHRRLNRQRSDFRRSNVLARTPRFQAKNDFAVHDFAAAYQKNRGGMDSVQSHLCRHACFWPESYLIFFKIVMNFLKENEHQFPCASRRHDRSAAGIGIKSIGFGILFWQA